MTVSASVEEVLRGGLEKIAKHQIGRDPINVWYGSDLCWKIAKDALLCADALPRHPAEEDAREAVDEWEFRRIGGGEDDWRRVRGGLAKRAAELPDLYEIRPLTQAAPDGWRLPTTLPHPKYAGAFWAAIRTTHGDPWEVHLIALDDETHDVHDNYNQGWSWGQYEFWIPLHMPAPPAQGAGG